MLPIGMRQVKAGLALVFKRASDSAREARRARARRAGQVVRKGGGGSRAKARRPPCYAWSRARRRTSPGARPAAAPGCAPALTVATRQHQHAEPVARRRWSSAGPPSQRRSQLTAAPIRWAEHAATGRLQRHPLGPAGSTATQQNLGRRATHREAVPVCTVYVMWVRYHSCARPGVRQGVRRRMVRARELSGGGIMGILGLEFPRQESKRQGPEAVLSAASGDSLNLGGLHFSLKPQKKT